VWKTGAESPHRAFMSASRLGRTDYGRLRVLNIRICIAKFDYAEQKMPNFVGRGKVCQLKTAIAKSRERFVSGSAYFGKTICIVLRQPVLYLLVKRLFVSVSKPTARFKRTVYLEESYSVGQHFFEGSFAVSHLSPRMTVIRDGAANSIALLIRQTTNRASKTPQQQL
jgi:hypothetical protein